MGCCHTTENVRSSSIKPKLDLDYFTIDEAKQILSQHVSCSIKSFEKSLISKITPKTPFCLTNFERAIVASIHTELIKFDQLSKVPIRPEILSEYKKMKMYLISKCKSKEGHYRYLNDSYSFKLVFELESEILEEFFEHKISFDDGISKYKRLVRGTFMMSGLESMYELMKITDKNEAFEAMNEKAKKIKEVLEENKKQLEKIAKKPLIPLSLEEVENEPAISIRSPSPILPSPVSKNSWLCSNTFSCEELPSKSIDTQSLSTKKSPQSQT